MGHVISDRVEEAWRNLPTAVAFFKDNRYKAAALKLNEAILHVGKNLREYDSNRLYSKRDELYSLKMEIERETDEKEMENMVVDMFDKVFMFFNKCVTETNEWFDENMPEDYKYTIKLREFDEILWMKNRIEKEG